MRERDREREREREKGEEGREEERRKKKIEENFFCAVPPVSFKDVSTRTRTNDTPKDKVLLSDAPRLFHELRLRLKSVLFFANVAQHS